MIYTPLTKKALSLAFEAHKNQLDKSELPYIFHPFHLAEQMSEEYTTCVALLHDGVEDSKYTIQDLIELGFPSQVIEAIKVLIHSNDIPYFDYINRVKMNSMATRVKIVDLIHNSDLTRLNKISTDDLRRIDEYNKALLILEK